MPLLLFSEFFVFKAFSDKVKSQKGTFSSFEIVDGAYVVETTTGDEIPTRRIGTRHDPTRSEGNGVYLVRRVGVPY